MKTRILFLAILASLFMLACDDNDNNINESKNANLLKVKMSVKENTTDWNILELVEFKLDNFSSHELFSSYDSIAWKVEGEKGNFEVFNKGESHIVFSWSHSFYYPGTYNVFLVGYKDNKVFRGDTIKLNISDNKDFLSYYWVDIKDAKYGGRGYVNLLPDYPTLSTHQRIYKGTPHILLSVWGEEDSDKQKKFLSDYMTFLYEKSVCDLNNRARELDKYYDSFVYKPKNSTPIAVWKSSRAKIMLLKIYDEENDVFEYQIYAEPYI